MAAQGDRTCSTRALSARRTCCVLFATVLLACGHTTHSGDGDDAAGTGVAGAGVAGAGVAGVAGTAGSNGGGGQSLTIDPGPLVPQPPEPHDVCACPYTRLGMTVMLGETNERLGFNIAGQSACATDQPAHISVVSGCGQRVSLALSADAEGGIPRLTIAGIELTYVDRQNEVWMGLLNRFEGRPDEGSVLTSSMQLTVVNEEGEARMLQLAFELCAEWSSLSVPC